MIHLRCVTCGESAGFCDGAHVAGVPMQTWFKSRGERCTECQDFYKFHVANPIVYSSLVRLARQARRSGRERSGMKMLWEVMRWERYLETNDPSGYKLNNNYTSRYARLIMETEPDLAGFFQTRRLRSVTA